ncbi:MAG: hypothetical protein K2O84_08955 [Oscillospiraceae bacterium]|nr:hypothetical protein [Oscillospiraceae bacterium]
MDKLKICPLMSVGQSTPAPCGGAECAWWARATGLCSIAAGADAAAGVEDQLNALNMTVETMGDNAGADRR